MKRYLPWWVKISAKIILSRLPFGYALWQKIGLFRHGHMDRADYVLATFREHVSRAGMHGALNGKVILELGPGDSIATAILAHCYGARAILLDAGSYATKELSGYKRLASELKRLGVVNVPNFDTAQSLDDVLDACDALYLTGGLKSFANIDNDSVDFIFSQAVLEHVRKHEFMETMKECFRVLKSEGSASHRVDLKDHLDSSLNNLRFSEEIWESGFFSSSGFYTNRIRFSEMIHYFEDACFSVDVLHVDRWEKLPLSRKVMDGQFSQLPEEELNVSGFDVLLHKS